MSNYKVSQNTNAYRVAVQLLNTLRDPIYIDSLPMLNLDHLFKKKHGRGLALFLDYVVNLNSIL